MRDPPWHLKSVATFHLTSVVGLCQFGHGAMIMMYCSIIQLPLLTLSIIPLCSGRIVALCNSWDAYMIVRRRVGW